MPAGKLTRNYAGRRGLPPRKTVRTRKYRTAYRSKFTRPMSTWKSDYKANDPFPPRKNFKFMLNYSGLFYNGTTGSFGVENIFRLNSCYDIDQTGGGHQPYGWDQMAQIYSRYKVNGVKMDIRIENPSYDGAVVAFLIAPPDVSTTLLGTTPEQIQETPNAITKAISDSGSQVVRFSQYFPIYQLAGITKRQFMSDISYYQAGVGADPNRAPRLHVAMALRDTSIAANTHTVTVSIQFTMYTSMWSRPILSQS